MGTIRVGTCGFCLRQRDYYGAFDVVELQQTFYRPPPFQIGDFYIGQRIFYS